MDVMMPGMDGPTACTLLREDPRTRAIPVILLTAKTHPGDRHHWSYLELAGVITKPFDPMRLVETVRRLLGWPEPV